jgi:hypothetical protein
MRRELYAFFMQFGYYYARKVAAGEGEGASQPAVPVCQPGPAQAKKSWPFLINGTHEIPRRGGALSAPTAGLSRETFMNHECLIPEDEKSPLPPLSKGGY